MRAVTTMRSGSLQSGAGVEILKRCAGKIRRPSLHSFLDRLALLMMTPEHHVEANLAEAHGQACSCQRHAPCDQLRRRIVALTAEGWATAARVLCAAFSFCA
jgi:hypothetical protein